MKPLGFSKNHKSRRGAAYFLALILMVMMGMLAMTMSHSSVMDLTKTANHQDSTNSRMAAESGLSLSLYWIRNLRIPGSTTESTFATNLATVLGDTLNSTYTLAGQSVYASEGVVIVPEINLPYGSFESRFSYISADRARLQVKGMYNGSISYICMDLLMEKRRPMVFDFGLASMGQILISGNSQIVGLNDTKEGSILSATESHDDAIHVEGSAVISGDLYTSGEDTYAVVSGSPTIGNTSDPSEWSAHLHCGVDVPPDFPELDASGIIPLATNVYTGSEGDVLSNIRIPAGTNPTFNHDMVLNGVIYVEAPNKVNFEGKATLNGIIVTEADHPDLSACELNFRGNVDAYGVEVLPDTAEFAAVKEQTGTFILAPGFAVSFAGHVDAVNGSIAADQLTFLGTAEGIIRGSVIGLEDVQTVVGGNVVITIDKANQDPDPAGFVKSIAFDPILSTYSEEEGN